MDDAAAQDHSLEVGLTGDPSSAAPGASTMALLQQGVALHQQARLAEAEALYRQALALAPRNFDALHLLGVLRHQTGHHEEALALIDAAIAVNPGEAPAHSNRGLALAALARLDEAVASFDRALALRGDFADALLNRGNVQARLGRHADALASFEAVLALRPRDVGTLCDRGNALSALGRPEAALESYDRALAVDAAHAPTLNNRGNVLLDLGRSDEALACYDRAIVARPDDPVAHFNRGNALLAQKRFEEALASYDVALALRPRYAEALLNRSNPLRKLGMAEKALMSCEGALALAPDYAEAHFNRGLALGDLDRIDDAIASYTRALELDPRFARAFERRAVARARLGQFESATNDVARALELDPDLPYARGAHLQWRLQCGRWDGIDQAICKVVDDVRAGKRVVVPFSFLAVSGAPADQLKCARIWTADACPPAPLPLWRGDRYDHDRIRIAYLSTDYREHPVTYKIAGVIEQHDVARFETIGVALGPGDGSAARRRMECAFERFIDAHALRDADLAAWLRSEEVDIVVDLNGFTASARSRVLAHRPAPIQVNYFGYPGTMGAEFIDYILADRFVVPERHLAHYSEAVVYLPDTSQPTDATRVIAATAPSRREAGLPNDGFVFCSFNNDYKIGPAQFAVWMRILHRVEGSVLWMLRGSASIESNLRGEAAARGIDPARLVFAPRVAYDDYLARFRLADLFLDTLPFNAGSTASDALWAGLPVLTCSGEAFASRMAGSLVHAIGLPELVTDSIEGYEALACRLATDARLHGAIRDKLARNRETHPLFDTDRFRRHIEAAYTTMWERYRRGERPAGFSVAAIQ